MNDLDATEVIAGADPQDFLGVVEGFPAQLREGLAIGNSVTDLPSGDFRSVAVLGMGGSGISGNVLELALADGPSVVRTFKGYSLPPWVDKETLVFAASYSGDTEETLETYRQAKDRGVHVVAVTTGGALADLASSSGDTVVQIPAGLQPRAALGYLSVPQIVIAEKLGLVSGAVAKLEAAAALMESRAAEYSRDVLTKDNAAKKLAGELHGMIPVVYGSEGIADVAAYRWKCQLNECAKVPAYTHVFPELNHNEVVGWNQLAELTTQSIALIVLRHENEHPRITKRIEVTLPLIQDNLGLVQEVRASGDSDLEMFFDLVYLGDFAATYLAIAQGVDPAPVDVIQDLKRRLAQA